MPTCLLLASHSFFLFLCESGDRIWWYKLLRSVIFVSYSPLCIPSLHSTMLQEMSRTGCKRTLARQDGKGGGGGAELKDRRVSEVGGGLRFWDLPVAWFAEVTCS